MEQPRDQRKLETLETIAQLDIRVLALEREKASHLYSKKHDFRASFCTLEEVDLKLAAQRKSEKLELRQQIARIKASVEGFKRMLADMKPGPTFVEKLKLTLEDIEALIVAFKEKQRQLYESLLQEELVIAQEVVAFEKRLESWLSAEASHQMPSQGAAAVAQKSRAVEPSAVPPAVIAFERFLQQTGGRQGGWDEYDHHTFLRIRNNYGGQPSFIEAAARELPTQTVSEIEQHEQWYSEYYTLLESKKTAIQTWRKRKESLKAHQIARAESNGTSERSKVTREEALAKEREERFAKLSAWKAQKEREHRQVEEDRLRAEQDKAKDREKEMQRKAVVKQRVKEYVDHREEERRAKERTEEEMRREEMARKRAANAEIHRFRDRDLMAAEEKKEMARAREAERIERERKLEKLKEQVHVNVSRDPSRLLRLTAGWEERKKAGGGSGIGGVSLNLPRRAVPSWRQGL